MLGSPVAREILVDPVYLFAETTTTYCSRLNRNHSLSSSISCLLHLSTKGGIIFIAAAIHLTTRILVIGVLKNIRGARSTRTLFDKVCVLSSPPSCDMLQFFSSLYFNCSHTTDHVVGLLLGLRKGGRSRSRISIKNIIDLS